MTIDRLTRRKLLTVVAGGGVASVSGLALRTDRSRAFTQTTEIQTGSVDGLLVDWRETYNGATLADTTEGTTTVSSSGPAITLGNVLPGDSGTLSVRLRVDGDAGLGEGGAAVEPELTVTPSGDLETPGLHEFLDAAVWYDTGLFGIDAFGARNGVRDFGERLVHPDARGTLEDVILALENGIVLDASPYTPGTSCLGMDDAVTVTVGWSFPTGQPNVNAVQGKSVEFDVEFDARQC